jgi:hypothetical protein
MDIIKNPVIIGLFAGTLTYIYMTYNIKNETDEDNKKNKKKKNIVNINLLIPLVVAVIFWFITYAYFENKPTNLSLPINADTNTTFVTNGPIKHKLPLPIIPTKSYTFTKDVADSISSDVKSFSLLTNGVNVPKNLPDIMIDMI